MAGSCILAPPQSEAKHVALCGRALGGDQGAGDHPRKLSTLKAACYCTLWSHCLASTCTWCILWLSLRSWGPQWGTEDPGHRYAYITIASYLSDKVLGYWRLVLQYFRIWQRAYFFASDLSCTFVWLLLQHHIAPTALHVGGLSDKISPDCLKWGFNFWECEVQPPKALEAHDKCCLLLHVVGSLLQGWFVKRSFNPLLALDHPFVNIWLQQLFCRRWCLTCCMYRLSQSMMRRAQCVMGPITDWSLPSASSLLFVLERMGTLGPPDQFNQPKH